MVRLLKWKKLPAYVLLLMRLCAMRATHVRTKQKYEVPFTHWVFRLPSLSKLPNSLFNLPSCPSERGDKMGLVGRQRLETRGMANSEWNGCPKVLAGLCGSLATAKFKMPVGTNEIMWPDRMTSDFDPYFYLIFQRHSSNTEGKRPSMYRAWNNGWYLVGGT